MNLQKPLYTVDLNFPRACPNPITRRRPRRLPYTYPYTHTLTRTASRSPFLSTRAPTAQLFLLLFPCNIFILSFSLLHPPTLSTHTHTLPSHSFVNNFDRSSARTCAAHNCKSGAPSVRARRAKTIDCARDARRRWCGGGGNGGGSSHATHGSERERERGKTCSAGLPATPCCNATLPPRFFFLLWCRLSVSVWELGLWAGNALFGGVMVQCFCTDFFV